MRWLACFLVCCVTFSLASPAWGQSVSESELAALKEQDYGLELKFGNYRS
mgnify:CR=1 FL=1